MFKTNTKVVQSNKLIEAQYRLTLQEKRLILWLISRIHKDDVDFKRYEISVVEFAKLMELNIKTQYKELKTITASLLTRLIQIEDIKTGIIKQLTWLCFVEWDVEGGVCRLEFHPELRPYLLQLKEQFTQISFADLIGFKGSYAARILELTAQYALRGKRITIIDDLKGWCGLSVEEYKLYADLKRKIIEPSKKEINEKTQYEISYKEIKKGNKVVALEWTVGFKPTTEETPTLNHTAVYKKELAPGDTGYVPPRYENCSIHEIVEFCKKHESTMRRDLIDYLLQVVKFSRTKTTIELTFDSAFFRDKVDVEEVRESLTKHFKVERVEMFV